MRDKSWLCNSLHSMLNGSPQGATTTWQSEKATEPPWWRRGAAPPCQPPSSAQATESSCTSRLTKVWQGLVGASAGVHENRVIRWYRVSVKMSRVCKVVSVRTKKKKHCVKKQFSRSCNYQSDIYTNTNQCLSINIVFPEIVNVGQVICGKVRSCIECVAVKWYLYIYNDFDNTFEWW